MAKHTSYQAIKKWRKARALRRGEVSVSSTPVRLDIIPLTEHEKNNCSVYVVGFAVCPLCGNKTQVVNDSGRKGGPVWDYFANHKGKDVSNFALCSGSEKRLSEVLPKK